MDLKATFPSSTKILLIPVLQRQRLSFISAILTTFLAANLVFASEKHDLTPVQAIRREYQSKHFDKANQMALKLLKEQEARLGGNSPQLIETLNLVIASACAGKKCADTTPWLLQLLELRKKVLGPEHPHVAVTLAMLGENAEMKGDLKKARQYYEKALSIRMKEEPSLVEATKKNLERIDKKLRQK